MNIDDINRLEAARREAMLAADVPALANLLGDDLVWVHASSKSDSKASLLEKFEHGRLRCFRLDHSEIAIRTYGPVALIQGRLEMDVAADGGRRVAVNRFAAVWTSEHSSAKLVLWQSTRVPD
jgi:ketosteroid isomerase-like protein